MTSSHQPPPPPEAGTMVKIIVGEHDAPLAEVTPYTIALPSELRPVQLDSSVGTAIGAMLHSLPGVVGASMQASSTTYLLTFAPTVAAQLQGGTATLMHALNGGARAIAVDATSGRMIGTGTLVAAQGLSSAATAIMLWQTLALATAQHYLHAMQQQLRTIHEAVQSIQDLLLAKEQARLIGHERYLQRTVDMVKRGATKELDMAAMSVQLEQMERECDEVQALMYYQMERQVPHMETAPLWAWFPWEVEGNVAAARKYVDAFDAAARAFAASVRVKGMIAAVRAQLFQQTQISLARLKEAGEDSIRGYTLIVKFYTLISARGKDVWASTDLPGFLNGLRRTLAQHLAERSSAIRSQFDQLGNDLSTTQRQITGLGTHLPPALLLQVDSNGIVQVYAAPPSVG